MSKKRKINYIYNPQLLKRKDLDGNILNFMDKKTYVEELNEMEDQNKKIVGNLYKVKEDCYKNM